MVNSIALNSANCQLPSLNNGFRNCRAEFQPRQHVRGKLGFGIDESAHTFELSKSNSELREIHRILGCVPFQLFQGLRVHDDAADSFRGLTTDIWQGLSDTLVHNYFPVYFPQLWTTFYNGPMIESPFGKPVPSIQLTRNSIVFVVAQIRFPLIASINDESFVAPFQELIRSEYPDLARGTGAQMLIGVDGAQRVESGTVWSFTSDDGRWQIAVTSAFVSLSTSEYSNRTEFLERLGFLVGHVETWLRPKKILRFGVRYVDRISGPKLKKLRDLINPEVCGPSLVSLGKAVQLQHSITECNYSLGENTSLRARWGLLPENASLDPSVAGVPTKSWVLDLDASVESINFDRVETSERAAQFIDTIYRYFRWATTDEFIRTHGGNL